MDISESKSINGAGSAVWTGSATGSPQWRVPILLFLCIIVAFIDKVNIAALFHDKAFQAALGVGFDPTKFGLLMTAFLIANGVSSLLLSPMADRINPKICLYVMLVAWGILEVLCAFATSYSEMMWLRIALGIFEGPMYPVAYAIVKRSIPADAQGRASSIWLLGSPVGAMFGIPMTLWILERFGWQATFYALALVSIPLVVVAILILKDIELAAKPPAELARGGYSAALREMLATPAMWLLVVFDITFLMYLWGLTSWLPTYFVKFLHVSRDEVWMYSGIPFVAMLSGEIVGGWFSDKDGRRARNCIGGTVMSAVLLVSAPLFSSPTIAIVLVAASAFAWGFAAPSVFALLASINRTGASAAAGGLMVGTGNLVSAVSPLAMGALIGTFGAEQAALVFLACVMLAGSCFLIPLIKKY